MRFALVQSEERLDRNALVVARALRQRGHEVTLIVPQLEASPHTPGIVSEWQGEGFAWIPVSAARLHPSEENFPRDSSLATARAVAGIAIAFDAVWFWERHWALPTLRERRFRDRMLPCVVVSAQQNPGTLPASLDEVNRLSSEQYALQWTDLADSGNIDEFDGGIAGLEELWKERSEAGERTPRQPATTPAVTVCVPYYEAPDFLGRTLESLEGQTTDDFTVVVVDDGSSSADGQRVFSECAERYAKRGWRFFRQPNLYPGAARNRAAREAATEFLLFLDSDDIAMPAMVERFLRAALLTGDDCLVAPNYGFRVDPEGPCALLYDPPGNSLIGSMGDDMHGGACIFVRREAFWSVGGFTEVRGVGFEDYEFHVRCNLAGLRWDVLPEFVYRYRLPEGDGSVSQSTGAYANLARVRGLYEERLRGSRLEQLPVAFASAFWRQERLAEKEKRFEKTLAVRVPGPPKLRLLLITPHFPFGMISGWHRRAQELIRYFGSRYELTLVTGMIREQMGPAKKEAFRYLHAIRGVEGSNRAAASSEDLPFRVRRYHTDNLQAALQSLPTKRFHAALIDQIFMAEFRKDIETVPVLTEQNIESLLLRQASERVWTEDLPEDYKNPLQEAIHLERYENRVWAEFPLRAVVSEVDRAIMDSRVNRGKTVVAPNGAHLSSYLPKARRETATVLFPGHLAYLPNVEAVEFLLTRIWPKVVDRKPATRLILAGRDPSERVKALAARARGVALIASPKSMDKVAQGASLTVAPLRLGSGTRCKILESMAWGLPVVSTTLGVEGIDALDGEHLLIRDDPDEFAEAILQLISDEALWQKLRANGRELVRARYSWDKVFEPLEDALLELGA